MHPILLSFILLFLPAKQSGVMICKSGTGYAYHSHYCRGLNECTHRIETISIGEAVSLGKKACGYCYKNTAAPSGPVVNLQCKATTKSGRQCSRKGGTNGYCWQHNK